MDASNTRAKEGQDEKDDTQSHNESSPSKQMSHLEPMVEENIVEVDSDLDHFLNQETEQHTSAAEKELPFPDPTDVFVLVPMVKIMNQ